MHRRTFAALRAAWLLTFAAARLNWIERELMQTSRASTPGLPCEKPVKRAPVNFPDHLVIGSFEASMYSGYVNVTPTDWLFYWLVESEDPSPDTPIIIWTNGGPGCSAMEGAATEHGPLVLFNTKEDSRLAPSDKLTPNPYSWHKQAHVIYVDQPRYVGFSCGTGAFVTTSVDAGRDMVNFIRGWRGLFPEHAHRDVIAASESYGGHYIPAWTAAILDYNAAGVSDPIKLIGLAIGNGIINGSVQDGTFSHFARRHGLIPPNVTTDHSWQSWGAREIMKNYLGYEPNYYDYRVMEQVCCGCSSYNYRAMSDFMMRRDVNKALNVCGDAGTKAFAGCGAGCIQLPGFDRGDKFDYSGALVRALKQGIQVTMYYGMQDTACNYMGGFLAAMALEWPGGEEFRKKPLEDLVIGEVPTGSTKSHGGLTWIQIEGAGHMVPINNPMAAFYAISTLMPPRTTEETAARRAEGEKEETLRRHTLDMELGEEKISEWLSRPGAAGGIAAAAAAPAATAVRRDLYSTLAILGMGLAFTGWAASRFFAKRPMARLSGAYLPAPSLAQAQEPTVRREGTAGGPVPPSYRRLGAPLDALLGFISPRKRPAPARCWSSTAGPAVGGAGSQGGHL